MILGCINKLDLRLPEDSIAWCRHPGLYHRTGGSLEKHANTRWHTLSTTCLTGKCRHNITKSYTFINPSGEIRPLHLNHSNYLWAVEQLCSRSAPALKPVVEIFLTDVCVLVGRKPPQTCDMQTPLIVALIWHLNTGHTSCCEDTVLPRC